MLTKAHEYETEVERTVRENLEWQQSLKELTDKEKAALVSMSPALHFATCIKITDKSNELIEPVPNILQLRMSQAYEVCQALGVSCMLICCKPRQVGCSTFAAEIIYVHEQRFRVSGITISDVRNNSQKLMQKIEDYESRDSYPWGNTMRSIRGNLEWSHGSKHEVDSAENWKAGIGDTRQAYHASEVGKWPKTGVKNDKRVMSAVLPSIAKNSKTCIIAESTPDGAMGWMYETYDEAVTLDEFIESIQSGKDSGEKWIRIFAGWWEFVEHQRSVTPLERAEIVRTMTSREKEGTNKYGWTTEQVAWRRDKLRTECGSDEDVFDEYYPEDDERCWLVSGRPRFNMSMLVAMENIANGIKPTTGYLSEQENGMVSFAVEPNGKGEIEVYEQPREGCRYVIACDPATGEDQTGGKNPDRTSIQVWRQGYVDGSTRKERKAMLVARVKSPYYGGNDVSAGHIKRLSNWYGGAMAVLEVNMGLGILELLKHENVPMYKRTVPSEKVSGTKVEQYGFKLKNRSEKQMLVEALATAIRMDEIDVRCNAWIDEAKKFVTKPNGREEAQAGAKDDDVMCGAMAYMILPSASEYKRVVRKRRRPQDGWKHVGAHKMGY